MDKYGDKLIRYTIAGNHMYLDRALVLSLALEIIYQMSLDLVAMT